MTKKPSPQPRANNDTSYLWNQQQRSKLCQATATEVEAKLNASLSDSGKASVDIWKTIIGVQMHFNDMEMRIRNFAVTVFAAVAGAAGFALKDKLFLGHIPLASALLGIGALSWGLFLFMDRYWYHRLLLGAVYHGAAVEKGLQSVLPAAALSATIKYESPVKVPFTDLAVHSDNKILIFYWTGITVMLVGALLLLQLDPPERSSDSSAILTATQQAQMAAAVLRCDILQVRVDAAQARRAAALAWLHTQRALPAAGAVPAESEASGVEKTAADALAQAESVLLAAKCSVSAPSTTPPGAEQLRGSPAASQP